MHTSLLLPPDASILSGDIFEGFKIVPASSVSPGFQSPWRAAANTTVVEVSESVYSGRMFEVRTTHVSPEYLFSEETEDDVNEAPGFCARLLDGQKLLKVVGSKKKSIREVSPDSLNQGDVVMAIPSMASPRQDLVISAEYMGKPISGYAVRVAFIGSMNKLKMGCVSLSTVGGSPVVVDGLAVRW